MINNKPGRTGFTLIELLVVIAIIGTLSGMVLVAMTDTRARARDARRVNDIYQIRKALELYYAENAIYPNLTGWRSSNNATAWAALGTALAPYMKQLPSDPINTVTSPATHATAAGTYIMAEWRRWLKLRASLAWSFERGRAEDGKDES